MKKIKEILNKTLRNKKIGYYDIDIWGDIAKKYNIKEKLLQYIKYYKSDIEEGIILHGEVYGPGIQKGYDYQLKEIQLALFDVELNGEYVNDATFKFFTAEGIKLPMVEYLYRGKWSKEIQEKYSKPVLIEGSKIYHEGIVIKATSGDKKKRAKVINQEYLIQNEKIDGTDFH